MIQKQELHQFVGEFMVRIVFAFRANPVVMSFDYAAIYADPIPWGGCAIVMFLQGLFVGKWSSDFE